MPQNSKSLHPFENIPWIASLHEADSGSEAPGYAFCLELWKKYNMLPNIQRHSHMVSEIAVYLAAQIIAQGFKINPHAVRAAGLLHDLGKTYCIKYGGNHAVLGGAWTLKETKNFDVAQGVILHVYWPWSIPEDHTILCLPFLILYADKRVRHDHCVSIKDRYEDILKRYGKTEHEIRGIMHSWKQTEKIEKILSKYLELNFNENSFNCGRLV